MRDVWSPGDLAHAHFTLASQHGTRLTPADNSLSNLACQRMAGQAGMLEDRRDTELVYREIET